MLMSSRSPVHGYPSTHSPYPQHGYPPAPSPHHYYPPPPPQTQYSASPPQAQSPYARPSYGDRGYSNHHSPAPDRHHLSSNSRDHPLAAPRGRGHYSNLSWTPATGSRGGIQIPPRVRSSRDAPKDESSADDDDNPFRPSKDLQVEDESLKAAKEKKMLPPRQPTPPKQESQTDNKIKFALKSKPAHTTTLTSDLSARMREPTRKVSSLPTTTSSRRSTRYDERDERRSDSRADHRYHEQPKRAEKRLVKRTKPRPTLPPELAGSDSVYYRKPGNESVVGSGTYGKVFKAVHVYTGDKVALKKIRMEGERDGVGPSTWP